MTFDSTLDLWKQKAYKRAIMFDHRQVNAWGLRNPTRYRVTAADALKLWKHEQREEADTDGQTCL